MIVGEHDASVQRLEAAWVVPGMPERNAWLLRSDSLFAPLPTAIAISVQFLIIVRTLGEYYRLRATLGPERGLVAFAPYITPFRSHLGGPPISKMR